MMATTTKTPTKPTGTQSTGVPIYKYVPDPDDPKRLKRIQVDAQGNPIPTREEKIAQYYPGYDASNKGLITTYGQPGGVTVTATRKTPETHPWLFPQGGKDVIAGSDFSRAEFPEGVGFPTVPKMTEAERRAAADAQNFYKTGQGVDPALLAGLSRIGGQGEGGNRGQADIYSNEFGQYATGGWDVDPRTGQVTFRAPSFRGVDQSGAPVDYSGRIPYGAQQQQDIQRGALSQALLNLGRNGVPGSGTKTAQVPDYARARDPFTLPDRSRSWSNTGFGADSVPTYPGASGPTPAVNTPAMTALKRALMPPSWRFSGG